MGSSVSIHSRVISHVPTAESFTGPYTKTKRGGGYKTTILKFNRGLVALRINVEK